MSALLDSRAQISPRAHIGTNVSVGPFTIIEDGAVIGDGTTIAANALIGCGARIGRDCRIHHGAIVGHMPQDLKYAGEETTCEIGDRTVVREYAVIHRGTGEGGRTVIGEDNFPVYSRFIMRGAAGNRGVTRMRQPGPGGMMGGQAYGPMMDDDAQAYNGPMMGGP